MWEDIVPFGTSKVLHIWFNVIDRVVSDHLLVQSDLVVFSGLQDQMFADGL